MMNQSAEFGKTDAFNKQRSINEDYISKGGMNATAGG